MDRRRFLARSGTAFGTALFTPALVACAEGQSQTLDTNSWQSIREQFMLDHSHIQMAQMLLASHPTPVREAIQKHRDAFDRNPALYWEENWRPQEDIVSKAAAKYMNVDPGEVVLTDSTTQSLAMLYNGFKLEPGDEILTTTHDHYATEMSLKYACDKNGAKINRIAEYADPATASVDEITTNISNAITDKTRIVAVTWVHSCTGIKLPIKAISEVIARVNSNRSTADRIYFCVDGVHGFGNQDEDISALGCDFFAAGTHKWIFGPRGTGILWGKKDAWDAVAPTIPAFRWNPYGMWLGFPPEGEVTFGEMCSPGGFHAFDHRWALDAAFEFQMEIGRSKVHQRTTELNSRLKDGIKEMKHVKLLTPLSPELSAGINCFEIDGLDAETTVKKFHERGVIASASPYRISYPRLTPCIINTEEEVDKSLEALEMIKA